MRVAAGSAGIREWSPVFLQLPCPWRAGGRVKDRAEPGRRGGAGGVLEATGREPDDVGGGEREPGSSAVAVCGGLSPVPGSGVFPVRAVPLAAFILSRVPGRGRAAWGGSASEGGQAGPIGEAPYPPGAGGRMPGGLAPGGGRMPGGLAPGRWPGCGHAARPGPGRCGLRGGGGQAADVSPAREHSCAAFLNRVCRRSRPR